MAAAATLTLADLGPVVAAMIVPVLLSAAAVMRNQHLDGTKTRKLIEASNQQLRGLIDRTVT